MLLLNKSNKNLSEIIILILSNEFPLTSKQLYYKINSKYKTASSQAIHKTVNQLVEQTIALKKNKQYSLNPEYLEKTIQFYQNTQNKYTPKTETHQTQNKPYNAR
ncbi:MAG: hypothetical protein JW703_02105 [Candidatus Diapherotrites archaeon]|nr:hypothetical protein [Candidatus Diapherotrites archaeon]